MEFSASLIALALMFGLTAFAMVTMVRAYKKPIDTLPFPGDVIEETSLPLSSEERAQFIAATGTFKAGDYRGAIAHFTDFLKATSTCAEGYQNMGRAYANIGDNDKALRSFLKASELYDQQRTKEGVDSVRRDLERLNKAS